MMRTAHLALVMVMLAGTGCMVGDVSGTDDPSGGGGGGTRPGYGGTTTPGGGSGSGDGSGSGSGGQMGGTSTPDAVLNRMDKAECDAAWACRNTFPADSNTFRDYYGNSQTDCYDVLGSDYYDVNAVSSSISAGKITFDPNAGANCLSDFNFLNAPNCGSFWDDGPQFPARCENVFVGKVANGGQCSNDWECDWSSFCDGATSRCTPSN